MAQATGPQPWCELHGCCRGRPCAWPMLTLCVVGRAWAAYLMLHSPCSVKHGLANSRQQQLRCQQGVIQRALATNCAEARASPSQPPQPCTCLTYCRNSCRPPAAPGSQAAEHTGAPCTPHCRAHEQPEGPAAGLRRPPSARRVCSHCHRAQWQRAGSQDLAGRAPGLHALRQASASGLRVRQGACGMLWQAPAVPGSPCGDQHVD